jgi:hypothetical protein
LKAPATASASLWWARVGRNSPFCSNCFITSCIIDEEPRSRKMPHNLTIRKSSYSYHEILRSESSSGQQQVYLFCKRRLQTTATSPPRLESVKLPQKRQEQHTE